MSSLTDQISLFGDAWRVPPYRKFMIGQVMSMAGDAVCLAALPVALLRADFGVEVFGVVMAAVGLGTLIGAIIGGVVADRSSSKLMLVGTDVARGLVQVIATWLILSNAQWWSLALVYGVFGGAIGISRPCAQVLLVQLLPRHALIAGNGVMHLFDNLTAIILPATVGVLIILWNPVWGVAIDGITFFCAAAFTALLPAQAVRLHDGNPANHQVPRGITVIIGDPGLSLGFFATLVVNVLCFPVFLVIAPYAVSARFGDVMWGWCLAASGFGACVGSIIAVLIGGHQRVTGLAVTCSLFLGCALVMLGMGRSAWIVLAAAMLIGVVEAVWLTGWSTAMQTFSPAEAVGKVVAVDTFATSGLHPFIYIGSGLVASMVGYSEALIITAIISFMGTVGIVLASLLIMRGRKSR